jgi:hypothetical protein
MNRLIIAGCVLALCLLTPVRAAGEKAQDMAIKGDLETLVK